MSVPTYRQTPPAAVAALPPDPMGPGPIAAYLAICLIWGSTFLAIRIAVETVPPWLMVAVRSILAGLLLGGFAALRGASLPNRRGLISAAASGTLMFACAQGMLAFGETRVPSGQAAVVNATLSLFMPLAAWLLGTAPPPGRIAAFGLALGFVGVVVLANPGHAYIDLIGCAAVQVSAASWAFGTAIARRWPPARTASMSSGAQMLIGGVVSLAFSGAVGEWRHFDAASISLRSVLAFTYLITIGSMVAFAAYGWLVRIWRPERLVTYTYINPIVALLIGAGVAGEAIGMREIAATLLILAAVAIVMLGNRRAARG